jgi:very-short-patch-repair endonuclease
VLFEITRSQAGVVSRAQAVRCGVTDSALEFRVRSGRWQRVYPGVFATFTGPLPWRARLWAAVLFAGAGAVLSHRTAAELHGLVAQSAGPVHVSVLHTRRVRAPAGLVVHRVVDPDRLRHPARVPPRTTVTETALDLAHASQTLNEAIGWLLTAVGSRLTTADRIRAALDNRSRMRWRRDLRNALDDAAAGCHSVLEFHYSRSVERAHRLPAGVRQRHRAGWYDDVAYPAYGVHVELDGRLAHPDAMRFRDHRRDNAVVVGGGKVLRYGYADVVARPCVVAAEVAGVLAASGWTGQPAFCPDCINGDVRPHHHVDKRPR